jgi:hypothetical protein
MDPDLPRLKNTDPTRTRSRSDWNRIQIRPEPNPDTKHIVQVCNQSDTARSCIALIIKDICESKLSPNPKNILFRPMFEPSREHKTMDEEIRIRKLIFSGDLYPDVTCLKSREAFRSRFICLPLVTFAKEQNLSQELTDIRVIFNKNEKICATDPLTWLRNCLLFGNLSESFSPFISPERKKSVQFFFSNSCTIPHKNTNFSENQYY